MTAEHALAWAEGIGRIAGPRYAAVIRAIEEALAAGQLRAGDRLPPQRELAALAGLNPGTITHAYAEMQKSGLVRGEVGRGTFINDRHGADGPASLWNRVPRPRFIDLSHNFPDHAARHPALGAIRAGMAAELDVAALLSSQVDAGLERHRAAGARWLHRFGIPAGSEDVMVTCGAQHGLLLSLGALSRTGDIVMTEELAFYGLKSSAAMLGRPLVGLRLDGEGIVPEHLENACRRTGARILCCTPTLHNPTTATMSLARRQEIVAICERYDVTIVEDDAYGFMPDPSPMPLAALAPERTVHISSLSKLIGPGLRIGFARIPVHLRHAFGVALRATTLMASPFNAEWAARLLGSASLETILRDIRAETREHQALAAACLPARRVTGDPAAYYLQLHMSNGWSADAFVRAAESRGVGVAPFSLFEVAAPQRDDTVRVCVNAAPNRATLRHAFEELAELLAAGPSPSLRQAVAL